MATYQQIQDYVKAKYGFQPKTCWIADVKEQAGLPVRRAWNRFGDERQVTCPPEKIAAILDAVQHFGMIKRRTSTAMNTLEEDTKNTIRNLIIQLFEHVYFGEPPKDAPYINHGYYLDEEGYQHRYFDILHALYNIPDIQKSWSERALRDQVGCLIIELGKSKEKAHRGDQQPIDFQLIAANWLQEFQIDFEEQEYCAPVIGLVVESPFTLGRVAFRPLKDKLPEIQELDDFRLFSNLSEHRDCLASARIRAESTKCAEILRTQIEDALNILRYTGALVWYNQPTKHIYLAGKEPKRTSYVLALDGDKRPTWIGDSLFWPVPFQVNDDFLTIAKDYGLWDISNWLINPDATPLQRVLLEAIQWFGDATQELRPIQAFMKYYIAIEMILKKEGDKARKVLPQRVAYLLKERNRDKIEAEVWGWFTIG